MPEMSSTVTSSSRERETEIVGQDRWQRIHALQQDGMPIAQIACELGIDRKTVRSCLARSRWRPYSREVERAPVLDAHIAWLEARAPRVNISARILHQELVAARGFTGSYGTVRDAVRLLRLEAASASLTQCRGSAPRADDL
ncbi:MAG: hypothetical protein R3E48_08575 [Burkholderiaceae bacterium]